MGTVELPSDLARAHWRFTGWRAQRQVGARIPAALWRLAVRLVRRHGVSRTAGALGVDYYSLKKRSEEAGQHTSSVAGPAFIELPPPAPVGKQCVFELDNSAGAKMRVQLLGYDAAEIEIVARTLWNAD